MKKSSLVQMLGTITSSMENGRIKIGPLFDALGHRGFGPILLVPALLVISPVGELPGACGVLGGLIFLASLEILFGQKKPWAPKKLRDVSFRSKKLCRGIEKLKPYAEKIDKYLENRLSVLADNEIILYVTALICMILSVGIMSLSLIPFAPAAFALPVFFFALGFTVHDGILIACGYGALLLAGYALAGLL